MNDQEEKFLITDQDGVRIITLNRPKKKNAFDQSMYPKMDHILKNADMDSSVKVSFCKIYLHNTTFFSTT